MKKPAPWTDSDKKAWLAQQSRQRSYQQEVLKPLQKLAQQPGKHFDLERYGALSFDPDRYPLYWLRSAHWQPSRQTVFVTGGVHGYETSGVQGAIRFLQTIARNYLDAFNLLVAPCISPWGYETINRWNPYAVDPNRSFRNDAPAEEAALLMQAVGKLNAEILVHIDLHETTDTDNSVFRPALAARDAIDVPHWDIPDGYYLVADSERPQPEFQRAIIEAVEPITHIAPADHDQRLIGKPITQPGVIEYPKRRLGLCAGFAGGQYITTTEVYPDSPRVNDEICIQAQVATLQGGLEYILKQAQASS